MGNEEADWPRAVSDGVNGDLRARRRGGGFNFLDSRDWFSVGEQMPRDLVVLLVLRWLRPAVSG